MTTRGDTFVDAANTQLELHTATGANGGWSWANQDGTGGVAQIDASNQVKLVGGGHGNYTAATVGSNDQYAQIQVMAASDSFPVTVRSSGVSGAESFYGVRFKAGNWEVWKFVSGTFTNLLTSAATLTAGDTAKIQIVGSTLTFSVNGTSLLNTTDSAVASGVPGLEVRGADGATDPWVKNFLADVAAISTPSPAERGPLARRVMRPLIIR